MRGERNREEKSLRGNFTRIVWSPLRDSGRLNSTPSSALRIAAPLPAEFTPCQRRGTNNHSFRIARSLTRGCAGCELDLDFSAAPGYRSNVRLNRFRHV
jgi:hypothetical protein